MNRFPFIAIILTIATFVVGCAANPTSVEVVAPKPYAVVSFTFDDAPRSVYTQAYPLLKAAGMQATIYLSTGFVEESGYIKWSDVKNLDASGWEIGAHTHAHQDLTKLLPSQMTEEIVKSQQILQDRGYKAVSFSAPFGEYGERELAELKKFYSSNRAAWGNGGINNYHKRDAYNLVSLGVTLETTLKEVRKQISTIKKDGGWLILQFHQIDNGQNEIMTFSKESVYTTKLFPEIMKLVQESQVPVRTVRDIIENP